MFALFFSDSPVRNYNDAISSETQLFNKLFHYALENGVYLPPSGYETCFISTAHNGKDIERAAEVLAAGIKALDKQVVWVMAPSCAHDGWEGWL